MKVSLICLVFLIVGFLWLLKPAKRESHPTHHESTALHSVPATPEPPKDVFSGFQGIYRNSAGKRILEVKKVDGTGYRFLIREDTTTGEVFFEATFDGAEGYTQKVVNEVFGRREAVTIAKVGSSIEITRLESPVKAAIVFKAPDGPSG